MFGVVLGGIGGYFIAWEIGNPQPEGTYADGLATTIGTLLLLAGLSLVGGAVVFTAERAPRWLSILVAVVGTAATLLLAQALFNPLGLLL
jgi:hypothetical protein